MQSFDQKAFIREARNWRYNRAPLQKELVHQFLYRLSRVTRTACLAQCQPEMLVNITSVWTLLHCICTSMNHTFRDERERFHDCWILGREQRCCSLCGISQLCFCHT